MSLYLKYRPIDFDNLVGQKFVKETLKKAIIDNKTIGAYLFCGPRGTGKTSTARIFAKTINCTYSKEGNPCLKCDICTAFLDEKLMDIIEIDAASYTGVDNIREIIEKAQFQPSKTQYKIYIIDEVHMLSKGAFNALLKILEEPPKHVKFILATTETHKVPETIISRCQRYDFKRISDQDIKERLLYIAQQEDIQIDEKSLEYIAKNSGGGLRNAISLFEQFIDNNSIEYDAIIERLGIVDTEELEEFLVKLQQKDTSIIDNFHTLIAEGKNISIFFKELIFFIKDRIIFLLKNKKSIGELLDILEILNQTHSQTKNSFDENTTFLIGILKILDSGEREKPLTGILSPLKEKEATKEKKQENISHNDIENIFGDTSSELSPLKEKVLVTKDTEVKGNNFNRDDFIEKLKKLGGKGGLTMAIRGAKISLNKNILHLQIDTKIGHTQITNIDNISLMKTALEEMGIKTPEIIS